MLTNLDLVQNNSKPWPMHFRKQLSYIPNYLGVYERGGVTTDFSGFFPTAATLLKSASCLS